MNNTGKFSDVKYIIRCRLFTKVLIYRFFLKQLYMTGVVFILIISNPLDL